MKSMTKRRLVVGMGLCVGAVMLARFGMNGPALIAALACVLAAIWLTRQLGPIRRADPAADYELNLLARLDNPNPTVHKQAEMERELHNWQQYHGSRGAS
jgi:hypothetical protein